MALRDSIRERTYESQTDAISRLLKRTVGPCANLLDVGCGDGRKTLIWGEALSVPRTGLFGIETYEPYLLAAKERFDALPIDLESEPFPWPDGSLDLVIANQVFEHIKNIFHLMGEICRVTRTGGHFLVSTPNLGSFHNRLLLAAGRQPTPIKVFCEHLRGFTAPALAELVGASGDFQRIGAAGAGFYPFPPGPGNALAAAWPSGSVYTIQIFRRARVSDPGYWVRWASKVADTRL